jgi:hypothetical protein
LLSLLLLLVLLLLLLLCEQLQQQHLTPAGGITWWGWLGRQRQLCAEHEQRRTRPQSQS